MKKNNKKGFTLVELVIVVAVMAILVAVAIPTVASITSSAQTSTDKSNARTLESMIKLEMAESSATTASEGVIADAVAKAKLGISEEKNFYFVVATGECVVGTAPSGTAGTDYILIDFDSDGSCKVGSIEVNFAATTSHVPAA